MIQEVSGQSYEDYIEEHVFAPLAMDNSYTSMSAARQAGAASGYYPFFGIPLVYDRYMTLSRGNLPSGGLWSSASDMGRYLIAHLNGGRYGKALILSPGGIAELHRGEVEAIEMGVSAGQYGMGWYIEQQDQTRVDSHSGMMPDFYTYMALLPEQKKGVVLLVNVNHCTMQLTLTEIGTGVIRLLAGNPPAPIQFGAIPWVQRGLLLIPLLQIAGVAVTLGLLRRWRQEPQRRPSRGRAWGLYILPPLIPNLLLVLIPVYLLASRMLGFMRLFAPDVTWITLISGGFAGIWVFLRTGLILRTLQKAS